MLGTGAGTIPRNHFRWSVWGKGLSGEALVRFVRDEVFAFFGETVYDPAAGTAGFLVAAYKHMRLAHSSPTTIFEAELDGKRQRRGLGDKLSAAQVSALQTATFFGNDVDPTMVRLVTMNLTLRGLPNVRTAV